MRKSLIGYLLVLALAVCSLTAEPAQQNPPSETPRPQVSVAADGQLRDLPTSAATVADLLAELGITLSPLDRTSPSPDTPISDGLHVVVTRVTRSELVEEVSIPAETVVLADPDSPAGFIKILVHGQDGLVRRTWRVWEKDGEVASRTVIGEEVVTAARDTVVVRGSHGLPSRAGYWRYWRTPLVMEATAYEPGPRSCGKWATGYTATGLKAQKGVVAVDERVIPMGTRLYIPGYGFAVAADRGRAIKGMRIDLCFATYREAIRFGRRSVKVYILD